MILKKLIFFFILSIALQSCNTVTGTVEGTVIGVTKDVKTTYHYTTSIFTKIQCGNLDLD